MSAKDIAVDLMEPVRAADAAAARPGVRRSAARVVAFPEAGTSSGNPADAARVKPDAFVCFMNLPVFFHIYGKFHPARPAKLGGRIHPLVV
jgi:hypothetical protein